MEFLVEFEITVPREAGRKEVERREVAEADAAAALVEQGHLLRVWKLAAPDQNGAVLGLYRADSSAELERLLEALPLYDWMRTKITPLQPHPNDPSNRDVAVASDGGGQ